MKHECEGQSCIGYGSAIAVVVSWTVNHSIFWALVHGFLGWFYLLYYVLTRAK